MRCSLDGASGTLNQSMDDHLSGIWIHDAVFYGQRRGGNRPTVLKALGSLEAEANAISWPLHVSLGSTLVIASAKACIVMLSPDKALFKAMMNLSC